jgi:hypothetical protein
MSLEDRARAIVEALDGKPALRAEVERQLRLRHGGSEYVRGQHEKLATSVAAFADRHKVGHDWHEPDNYGISATVFGTHLDNACGSHVSEAAIDGGYQEYVVEIVHRESSRDGADDSVKLNLSDLIAVVHRYFREHIAGGRGADAKGSG